MSKSGGGDARRRTKVRTPEERVVAQLKSAIRKRRKEFEVLEDGNVVKRSEDKKKGVTEISASSLEQLGHAVGERFNDVVKQARLVTQMAKLKVVMPHAVYGAIHCIYPPRKAKDIVDHCKRRVEEQARLRESKKKPQPQS
jgi:hypothetical protein